MLTGGSVHSLVCPKAEVVGQAKKLHGESTYKVEDLAWAMGWFAEPVLPIKSFVYRLTLKSSGCFCLRKNSSSLARSSLCK